MFVEVDKDGGEELGKGQHALYGMSRTSPIRDVPRYIFNDISADFPCSIPHSTPRAVLPGVECRDHGTHRAGVLRHEALRNIPQSGDHHTLFTTAL